MTVFIGNYGKVELRRRSLPRTLVIVATDTSRQTFTARATNATGGIFYGSFITGDRVNITAPAGTNLTWLAASNWASNTQENSIDRFIHVDQVGSIRLYSTLASALRGDLADASPLVASQAVNMTVTLSSLDTAYRLLAAVTSYELSTSRETIDVTALSEEFRTQYSGLMSGSGRLTCIWDYASIGLGANTENANYLLQLVTRTQIGGEFNAKFYLKTDRYNPSTSPGTLADELYYEVSAVITNAAVAFQLDSKVEVAMDFVTTGQIQLQLVTAPVQNVVTVPGTNITVNAQNQTLGANPVTN